MLSSNEVSSACVAMIHYNAGVIDPCPANPVNHMQEVSAGSLCSLQVFTRNIMYQADVQI